MQRTQVGVIRGGIGSEYEVSLETGRNILKHIPQDKYRVFDILVTKDGKWQMNGFPITLEKLSKNIDVIFNALHGEYGEDGKIQREFEQFGVPYTGSGVFASAISINKALAKYYFSQAGIKTPQCAIVKNSDNVENSVHRVFKKISSPYVVKPISLGSSIGISVVKDFSNLLAAVEKELRYSEMVLVEEYISGREITCGVIDGMGQNKSYAIFPVEIVTPEGSEFFDYSAKYSGETLEVCPANLLPNTTKRIQDLAVRAHKALGLRHYSRSDFILSKHGLYILETNSLPGLTEKSLFTKVLKTAGLELPEFLDYILTLALDKK